MSRRAVDELKLLREKDRFVRGLVSWIGFKQTGVTYSRDKRYAGETKYPYRKMIKFAFDGITSFSTAPLKLATWTGYLPRSWRSCTSSACSSRSARLTVEGWATIMVAMLFLGSVQLICLGILGEYLGRIFNEVKPRPMYVRRGDTRAPARLATHRPDTLPRTVFLTGGAGFVGARLLEAFSQRGDAVVALDRSGSILRHPKSLETSRSSAAISSTAARISTPCRQPTVVMHLAASTGKASEREHSRTIASGTRCLWRPAAAQASQTPLCQLDRRVISGHSTLPLRTGEGPRGRNRAWLGTAFAILRPTMILGRGSTILGALKSWRGCRSCRSSAPDARRSNRSSWTMSSVHPDRPRRRPVQIRSFDIGGPRS